MGSRRLRLEPLKMDAFKIVVMTGEMIGGTIVEVAGEMTAAVIATTTMIATTTEEMIGMNPMKITEMFLRVSRLRLPSKSKRLGTTTEMTTLQKTLRTWSSSSDDWLWPSSWRCRITRT